MRKLYSYIFLIISFLIYSLTSVFTKLASMSVFLSFQYLLFLCGAICVIGVFAMLWQQIIRRLPVSDAFMWKGTAIIWTMLLANIIFGEPITIRNIIGSIIIIVGIALYALSERKEVVE